MKKSTREEQTFLCIDSGRNTWRRNDVLDVLKFI